MAVVLQEVQVKELVSGKRHLVYADVDDSLEKALGLLSTNNILAMPVRKRTVERKEEDGSEGHKELNFCGLLSVLDIAALAAREAESIGEGESVRVEVAMRRTAESWHMLLIDPHATVGRAMEYLGVRGFHRALVPNVCLSDHAPSIIPLPCALVEDFPLTSKGEELRVLSQMDIARFISQYEGRFGLALSQSLESVGLEGGRVLSATKKELLSDALNRMSQHAVTALAVVQKMESGAPWASDEGVLVDTLSASDLRGFTISELREAKSITVGEFLAKTHGAPPRKLLTCTGKTELRRVLKEMVENGVHRLWVTPEPDTTNPNAPLHATGVVSLSDLVRVMRILPVTNSAGEEEDLTNLAMDSFMWMDWML